MNRAPIHLSIRNLNAFYGESHVLHGINLNVHQGEVVSILGRNGAGRTTLLRAVMGLMPRASGRIMLQGADILGMPSHQIVRRGVGYCPEERGIYASLTCLENLMLPPRIADTGMSEEEIASLFPNLKERYASPGTKLSGGEQQMLALARIFRTGARLLLLDEISEGLAPVIVQSLGNAVRQLKQKGFTVVLVEQNFRFSERLADRFYVLEEGSVVAEFTRDELNARREELSGLLGL
ncbi:ABC transporter ATP-binding protein [Noviherbaspirillum denitrificans]|uniref:ABC transporter ATP-binding protein n=1 Tax=Noviherbaspirillum denitrificans TaxID=1968433 RepID=A0A254TCJ0_9BURK|nr:ABC transporter ATP-binding protein [Noviherbaspirillum denitrificans]OWW19887.1 ABC transporter ATP-binding protein [Noviherbaspirillum denitrificans]